MMLKDNGTEFEAPPAGTHPARLYRIIDLGTQQTEFQGQINHQRKLLFTFELLGDELMSDGRPFSVSRRFTASLGKKAALRAFLEAWRGKAFTDAELSAGLDLSRLLGQYALLNLVETERGGRVYTNISSASPLPRSMPKPEGVNDALLFDLAAPDWDVFDTLTERLQATIQASPEYKAATAPAGGQEPGTAGAADADYDDDIPF